MNYFFGILSVAGWVWAIVLGGVVAVIWWQRRKTGQEASGNAR